MKRLMFYIYIKKGNFKTCNPFNSCIYVRSLQEEFQLISLNVHIFTSSVTTLQHKQLWVATFFWGALFPGPVPVPCAYL